MGREKSNSFTMVVVVPLYFIGNCEAKPEHTQVFLWDSLSSLGASGQVCFIFFKPYREKWGCGMWDPHWWGTVRALDLQIHAFDRWRVEPSLFFLWKSVLNFKTRKPIKLKCEKSESWREETSVSY